MDCPAGHARESGRWTSEESTMLVSTEAGNRPLRPSGSSIPGRGRRETPMPLTFWAVLALSASLARSTTAAALPGCTEATTSDEMSIAAKATLRILVLDMLPLRGSGSPGSRV